MSDEMENLEGIDDSEAYQEDDLDLILEELEEVDEDEDEELDDDEMDEDEEDDNPFAAYDPEEWN